MASPNNDVTVENSYLSMDWLTTTKVLTHHHEINLLCFSWWKSETQKLQAKATRLSCLQFCQTCKILGKQTHFVFKDNTSLTWIMYPRPLQCATVLAYTHNEQSCKFNLWPRKTNVSMKMYSWVPITLLLLWSWS